MKYIVSLTNPDNKTESFEENKKDFFEKMEKLLEHPLLKNDGVQLSVQKWVEPLKVPFAMRKFGD